MFSNMLLGYHFLIYRREQFWLPAALWALFVLLIVLFRDERQSDVATGFLAMVLPMLAGVLAAGALVEDPALELQLAAPRAPWRTMVERLAMLLGLICLAALAFQVVLLPAGVGLDQLGNVAQRQLVWLVPSLALVALSNLIALGAAQSTAGALGTGLVWLFQLIFRDWLAAHPVGRYLYLFQGANGPTMPDLLGNQLCLVALTAGFCLVAALLLRREERYL
ncbi:MAG: hypothetical protein ACYC4L_18775 [Chloroflexota bacterium]